MKQSLKDKSSFAMLLAILSSLFFYSFVDGEFSTSECGITKTCYRNIPGCSLSDPSCLFFSYTWVSTNGLLLTIASLQVFFQVH